MSRPLVQFVILAALTWLIPRFAPSEGQPAWAIQALALGFAILAARSLSLLLKPLGVPMVTSCILLGLAAGPHALGLITREANEGLALINTIALVLIALTAGGELVLPEVRPLLRTVATMIGLQTPIVFAAVFGAFHFLAPHIPFVQELSRGETLAVGLFLAGLAVSQSPAVAVAVITDTGAKGRFTQTVLANVIVVDVVVIVLFAGLFAVAQTLVDPEAQLSAGEMGGIVLMLFGSAALGFGICLGLASVLSRAARRLPLLIGSVTLLIAATAGPLGLDPAIVALAAGFGIRNFTATGRELIRGVESIAPLIFAVFFTMAGASLDLTALPQLWPVALALIAVRMAALWGSTNVACRLAGTDEITRRWAWLTYISQAGITLGLSALVASRYDEWGVAFQTLVVTVVGIHELIGPPLFKLALARSGEVGARSDPAPPGSPPRGEGESPPGAAPSPD